MKSHVFSIALVIGFVCIQACGESAAPELSFPQDYSWYADSSLGFRIAYPSHWDDSHPKAGSMDDVILGGAHFPAIPDSFHVQLDITVMGPGYDLEVFQSNYGADETEIAGLTAYVANGTVMGTSQKMAVFPGNGRYFFVQCVANPKYFGDYGAIFDDILGSFEIID